MRHDGQFQARKKGGTPLVRSRPSLSSRLTPFTRKGEGGLAVSSKLSFPLKYVRSPLNLKWDLTAIAFFLRLLHLFYFVCSIQCFLQFIESRLYLV